MILPAWGIDSLPPSSVTDGVPLGSLNVATTKVPIRFDAPGLVMGFFFNVSLAQRTVGYHIDVP